MKIIANPGTCEDPGSQRSHIWAWANMQSIAQSHPETAAQRAQRSLRVYRRVRGTKQDGSTAGRARQLFQVYFGTDWSHFDYGKNGQLLPSVRALCIQRSLALSVRSEGLAKQLLLTRVIGFMSKQRFGAQGEAAVYVGYQRDQDYATR